MYKLYRSPRTGEMVNVVFRLSDGACIPMVEDNTDYQAYLLWLSEGNQPESADE